MYIHVPLIMGLIVTLQLTIGLVLEDTYDLMPQFVKNIHVKPSVVMRFGYRINVLCRQLQSGVEGRYKN